jgi:hypothetical protein
MTAEGLLTYRVVFDVVISMKILCKVLFESYLFESWVKPG